MGELTVCLSIVRHITRRVGTHPNSQMLQCEPARHHSAARCPDLWRQPCDHLSFIESPLCFSCCLTPDTPLVTPGPIPRGQWILAPCGQLTSTFWDLAGPIGIFMSGSDSPSVCCFCSQ